MTVSLNDQQQFCVVLRIIGLITTEYVAQCIMFGTVHIFLHSIKYKNDINLFVSNTSEGCRNGIVLSKDDKLDDLKQEKLAQSENLY